jgi:hypothetical protein
MMGVIIIANEIPKEKILAPKPKRVFPKQKKYKKKKNEKKLTKGQKALINGLRKSNTKTMNLDFISFEEINKDFNDLIEQQDEEICYDEISNILSSSSEESSSDNKNKIDIVKRPKKPFIGNVNFSL